MKDLSPIVFPKQRKCKNIPFHKQSVSAENVSQGRLRTSWSPDILDQVKSQTVHCSKYRNQYYQVLYSQDKLTVKVHISCPVISRLVHQVRPIYLGITLCRHNLINQCE